MIHTVVDSPLGPLTLVADDEGRLAGLYMQDQRYRPADERFGPAVKVPAGPDADRAEAVLTETADQLEQYFAGTRRSLDVPRSPVGTAFQRQVWDALARIPYGETRTYAEVARELGRPTAVRAVGAAIGRNPLCVVVPCHRVVGTGGALTGYAGGLVRKQRLLDLENAPVAATASRS
ncbi:methylated-DNA--[protein]-cysteine S-methyltransferase [Cellulomonas sp. SG140]|uniref:methylated-DNA--[protein]-cysteine S-methyltransferase n=1 Tax=Cellulomonas sp. SG140 TaxID=2976536 RepID=UPI0021E74E2F|nr:methylated-DNA--[protein]-cysteine S-methyltransferase [Cellulomonas sp. SG140]